MKILKAILALVGVLLPFALVVMLVLIFQSEDLEAVKAGVVHASGDRELLAEANAAIGQGRAFECGEAALNAHIGKVLAAREDDRFEMFVEFEGLWVRLLDGGFEVIFERDVLGVDSTVAARIEVVPTEEGHDLKVSGGRFGRLPVPAGALYLIRGGLKNIAAVFEPEKGVLSKAGSATFTPGRMRLERRPSQM